MRDSRVHFKEYYMKIEKSFSLTINQQLEPLLNPNLEINYFDNNVENQNLNFNIISIQNRESNIEIQNNIQEEINELKHEKLKQNCIYVSSLSLKLISFGIGITPMIWVGVKIYDKIINHNKITPIEIEVTSLGVMCISLIAKVGYNVFNKIQKDTAATLKFLNNKIIELKFNNR
jgi:hypothetical protein